MGSTIQNPLVLIPLLTIVLGLLIYFLSSPVIPEDELHRCIEDFTIPTSQNATFEYDLADRDVSPELLNQILEESATPNIKPVNDFKATEVNDGIGADLIQAFKIPDVPGITADLVNTIPEIWSNLKQILRKKATKCVSVNVIWVALGPLPWL